MESDGQPTGSVQIRAPGRINLIGEHVDYLDGLVMPAAINREIVGHATLNRDDESVWVSSEQESATWYALDAKDTDNLPASWLRYVVGVLALYERRGIVPATFRLQLSSDIPGGAGLSSSAALETAVALAVEHFAGVSLAPEERALLCQQAEHEFAGVPCGIMDQMAVGCCRAGHAMLLDCRDGTARHIAIPPELAIVVANTGVSHALADGGYALRREQCEEAARQLGIASFRELRPADLPNLALEEDLLRRRVRHVVTETARVEAMAAALPEGDLTAIGELMAAGHDSLRDDFEVSCPELDVLVDAARDFGPTRGLVGARMTGGGFGGSTVNLVRRESAGALMDHLAEAFERSFGRHITPFVTEAAVGARIQKMD